MEKRKIFLTYQEQEKVLLNIIAQGEYQQLPQMVKNGYPLSMTVLETLRWSRQTSLIIRLLKKEFAYVGDNAALFDFLQTLLGEKQAARLIVEESQKNENCLEEHPLAGLLIYLPPEMLAENGFWDKLKQNHEWQILAKYGHIDDVILMETWTYPAEAAKVLSEYQAEKRIVELKKYLWLVKMPDGPGFALAGKTIRHFVSEPQPAQRLERGRNLQKTVQLSRGVRIFVSGGKKRPGYFALTRLF